MGALTYDPMTPQEGDSELTLLGKILTALQGGGVVVGGGGSVGVAGDNSRWYNGDTYLKVGSDYYLVSAISFQGQIMLDIAQTPTVLP